MPKSEAPKKKNALAAKGKKSPPTHFPSKPYMRALRTQSPTSVPTAAWSTSDDELLVRSKTAGKKWVEISPLFPGKTSNACRKRYTRLVSHAKIEWDEFKERDLAVEFMNGKVKFFQQIADNLKLDWRQVEKKCIEMGFKGLSEKGKKLPLHFTSMETFRHASTSRSEIGGGTDEAKMLPPPPLPSPATPRGTKAESDTGSSNSDNAHVGDTSRARPPRLHDGAIFLVKGFPIGRDVEEEISQDGGDELDDDDDGDDGDGDDDDDDDTLPSISMKAELIIN